MKTLIGSLILSVIVSVAARASNTHCHTYELPEIHTVELNAFAAIDIRQGKVNELTVSAGESFIEHLDVQIVDSTLIVRDKRPQSYWLQQSQFFEHLKDTRKAPSDVHFVLTLQNPKDISLSGYLTTKLNKIKGDDMSLTFTGSGSLKIRKTKHQNLSITANGHIKTELQHVYAGTSTIKINGNGKVGVTHAEFENLAFLLNGIHTCTLDGKARDLLINMQGAGTCSGQDFIADNAKVGLQGSSELILEVDRFLQATTMDSSRVRYYGKPEVKNNGADITRLASSTPTRIYF